MVVGPAQNDSFILSRIFCMEDLKGGGFDGRKCAFHLRKLMLPGWVFDLPYLR